MTSLASLELFWIELESLTDPTVQIWWLSPLLKGSYFKVMWSCNDEVISSTEININSIGISS